MTPIRRVTVKRRRCGMDTPSWGGGDMPDAWNPDALQRIQEEMQAD